MACGRRRSIFCWTVFSFLGDLVTVTSGSIQRPAYLWAYIYGNDEPARMPQARMFHSSRAVCCARRKSIGRAVAVHGRGVVGQLFASRAIGDDTGNWCCTAALHRQLYVAVTYSSSSTYILPDGYYYVYMYIKKRDLCQHVHHVDVGHPSLINGTVFVQAYRHVQRADRYI